MNLDEIIKINSIGSILNIIRYNKCIQNELIIKTNYLDNIYTNITNGNRLQCYMNNNSLFLCPICGEPVSKSKFKFNKTCSYECKLKLGVISKSNTDLKKYGVKYYSGDKNKRNKTLCINNLQKYGTKYTGSVKEFINKKEQTCIERYGSKSPLKNKQIREKIKNTNLEKYGNINAASSNIIKEKIKNTNLEKYGVEVPIQNIEIKNKIQQTCIERYNVKTPLSNENIREKIKNTNLEKYNTEYPILNKDIKDKALYTLFNNYSVKNPYCIDYVRERAFSKEAFEKRNNTMRKNNTFNTSKSEEKLYQLLLSFYPQYTILREYTDNRYINKNGRKYRCDFYIKELDIFIEFNGSMFHNKRKFNKNNLFDLEEANNLIFKHKKLNKEKTRYLVTYYVWTQLDVEKRNTALKNKLKYIEIFDNLLKCKTLNMLKEEIENYK